LWNVAKSSGHVFTSLPYTGGASGNFDLSMNMTGVSNGVHSVTVKISDVFTSHTVTFVVDKAPTGVVTISRSGDDITLYPNPASNEVNLVYNADADVKTISIYNIIGKAIAVYKTTVPGSANLNIENIPSGIYFVRLVDSDGTVVGIRKFTKQ
jgi:Secretion system C-terminal sorting domain